MIELPGLIGREVAFDAEGPVLDAALIAALLGLDVESLRAAMARRAVFSVVERGEGDDAGRHRLTLRHRATEAVLVVDAAGRVIRATRRGPPQLSSSESQ
jgi:hypothetical protein